MKRIEREIYGFGPRLSTREDGLRKIGAALCFLAAAGLMVVMLWT